MDSTQSNNTAPIHTREHPHCPICGAAGVVLYQHLEDRFFGVPGQWTLKRCLNTSCNMLWLDPYPLPESIAAMYKDYPTHDEISDTSHSEQPRNYIIDAIRKAYLYTHYNYATGQHNSLWYLLVGMCAYLHPAWRDTQEAHIFYMPFIEGGTLLDVGCGSGGALSTMRNKGWKVTGIDFDGDAIAVAKKKGLDARQGDIFSQAFPDETFDAILMSHVIEHVPNPIDVFRECRRILKKNGIIVALTPNAGSLGHNRYARNWRGLETPHHLQLFNPHSLRILAQKSGFKKSTSFSSAQGTQYIIDQSKLLTHRKTMSIYDALPPSLGKWHRLLKEMMWLAHGWIHTIIPYKDEVAVLICRK